MSPQAACLHGDIDMKIKGHWRGPSRTRWWLMGNDHFWCPKVTHRLGPCLWQENDKTDWAALAVAPLQTDQGLLPWSSDQALEYEHNNPFSYSSTWILCPGFQLFTVTNTFLLLFHFILEPEVTHRPSFSGEHPYFSRYPIKNLDLLMR